MPVYNCKRYVSQAIESILNQTYSGWELYVCDDGSTDGTQEILQGYRGKDHRLHVMFNHSNVGKIATVGRAYKFLKGRHVIFHDSDDISHPERFQLQMDAFQEDRSIGLVGCGYVMIDQRERVFDSIVPPSEHEEIMSWIPAHSPFHFPTVMFRKEYLDEEGCLFREFFGDNNEDVDLAYRILTRSKGRNIAKVLYVYRILHDSISRKQILRNAIYFYSIARDLALARARGEADWLNHPVDSPEQLTKYERLKDQRSILLYANSVSYFLSYRLYGKAIRAAFSSLGHVSIIRFVKLMGVTFLRAFVLLFKKRTNSGFNIDEFLRSSAV